MKRTLLFVALIPLALLSTLVLGGIASADLADGLVAYYPFNGNAADESGNDGVVYGSTLTEDSFGNPDNAYSFDGVDDYIDIGGQIGDFENATTLADDRGLPRRQVH
jgi:hypothetical protein